MENTVCRICGVELDNHTVGELCDNPVCAALLRKDIDTAEQAGAIHNPIKSWLFRLCGVLFT